MENAKIPKADMSKIRNSKNKTNDVASWGVEPKDSI